jgi:hypothetical protein
LKKDDFGAILPHIWEDATAQYNPNLILIFAEGNPEEATCLSFERYRRSFLLRFVYLFLLLLLFYYIPTALLQFSGA